MKLLNDLSVDGYERIFNNFLKLLQDLKNQDHTTTKLVNLIKIERVRVKFFS